ncbi:predicted protein, partial [Ostreococcus lucimarinus CCE9901]
VLMCLGARAPGVRARGSPSVAATLTARSCLHLPPGPRRRISFPDRIRALLSLDRPMWRGSHELPRSTSSDARSTVACGDRADAALDFSRRERDVPLHRFARSSHDPPRGVWTPLRPLRL